MMMHILNWWAVWWMVGFVSLPVAMKMFSSLSDKGYALARLLGVLVISYVIWLGASLKIVPFSSYSVWIVFGLWVGVNWIIFRREQKEIVSQLKSNGWKWLRVEAIFVVFLCLWSWVRTFSPDINGLEKFMDYGFMNAILRSEFFPPNDMWFAGKGINYYYYGHYVSALMTRMSQVPAAVSYNLMIATIMANAIVAVYSLVGSLVQWAGLEQKHNLRPFWWRLGGTVAVFLLVFRGNLHLGAYELGKWLLDCPTPTGEEIVCTSKVGFVNPKWFPDVSAPYWYPDATRYIPYTIHEFPIYSFIVADLHAHLINLPFVILYISFLLQLVKVGTNKLKWWLVGGWVLGIFYMTNAWDWPIYMLLTGLVLLYLQWRRIVELPAGHWKWLVSSSLTAGLVLVTVGLLGGKLSVWPEWVDLNWLTIIVLATISGLGMFVVSKMALPAWSVWKPIVYNLVLPCVIILVVSILTALPFHLAFEQIAQGVDYVAVRSDFSKLLTLWGWDWFMGLVLVGITILTQKKFASQKSQLDGVMLVIWGLGIGLIVIPEFIYIKDIYIQEYHRANTMFKLVYQSWTLFAIVSSYTLIRLLRLDMGRKGNLVKIPLLLVIGLMIWQMGRYPFVATQSYYSIISPFTDSLNVEATRKGLDGELWLKEVSPNEYAVLEYLKQLKGARVIVEAVGDSYTEYNRFSAYSGLPTIEGWLVHEWLWRGSFDEPGRRASEVEHIYTAKSEIETKPVYEAEPVESVPELIKNYNVEYIILGEKEREKYSTNGMTINEPLLEQLGDVVFVSGESKVYKVRANP